MADVLLAKVGDLDITAGCDGCGGCPKSSNYKEEKAELLKSPVKSELTDIESPKVEKVP